MSNSRLPQGSPTEDTPTRQGGLAHAEAPKAGGNQVVTPSEMSVMDKITGCMALLVHYCMKDTNADTFTIETTGLSYKSKLLGNYRLRIDKVNDLAAISPEATDE